MNLQIAVRPAKFHFGPLMDNPSTPKHKQEMNEKLWSDEACRKNCPGHANAELLGICAKMPLHAEPPLK